MRCWLAPRGSKEDVAKSIDHYQQALKLDPSASIIFEELTDLYIQTGRLRDAVTQAEDLLKQNPDNLDARRMLGRIYPNDRRQSAGWQDQRKLPAPGHRSVSEIVLKDPKDAESWVTLGRLYSVSHNSPEAERSFKEALKIDPENDEALTGLGSLYMDLGDTKSAIAKLKAATDKASERTLAALAKAYEDVQDYKNAAGNPEERSEIAPDDQRYIHELAEDLLYSDQVDEALKLYQDLATEEPKVPDYQLASQIYRVKGDLTKAREALNKAKQADSQSLGVRDEEVSLLQAEKKYPEAIAALKSLLDDTARKNYSDFEKKTRPLYAETGRRLPRGRAVSAGNREHRQIATLDAEAGPQVSRWPRPIAPEGLHQRAERSRKRAQEISQGSDGDSGARFATVRPIQSGSGRLGNAHAPRRQTGSCR